MFLENLSQLQECPPPERGKESKAFELISNSRAKKKKRQQSITVRLQAAADRQSSAFIRACCPTCIDSHPVDLPLASARSSVERGGKKRESSQIDSRERRGGGLGWGEVSYATE